MRKSNPRRTLNARTGSIFPRPPRLAVDIVADSTGMTREAARDLLKELVDGGFAVVPMMPTNGMLLAYLESYGQAATNLSVLLQSIGKARQRWQAMCGKGIGAGLAMKRPGEPRRG